MSSVTKPVILDETGKRIATAVEKIAIAQAQGIDITDYNQIQQIVQLGLAREYFQIGDQIVMNWSDGTNTYEMPWGRGGLRSGCGRGRKHASECHVDSEPLRTAGSAVQRK